MDTTKELSDKIREYRPLIHSITNYVTVNDCANALLAIGARPVMSHAPEEAAEITSGSDGLELNLGATEYFESMLLSAYEARDKGIPVVVDPVGVSGSTHRREFLKKLIENCYPTVIRGNRSEILAIIRDEKTETGVDSVKLESDASDEDILSEMQCYCRMQKQRYDISGAGHGLILVCSGSKDLIASQDAAVSISGGSTEMAWVTGTGCMSSVIMAAFISGARLEDRGEHNAETELMVQGEECKKTESKRENVEKISDFEACVSAVKYIDAAAERAEENLKYLRAKEALPFGNYGTGSYRVLFMDQLSVNRI